jgi:hypothetical protein
MTNEKPKKTDAEIQVHELQQARNEIRNSEKTENPVVAKASLMIARDRLEKAVKWIDGKIGD